MKWVLLFRILFVGNTPHNFEIEQIQFESKELCEVAIKTMYEFNYEEAKRGVESNQEPPTRLGPLLCIQTGG